MKVFSRIMVCLYMAVAVFPLAAMGLALRDHAIFGALPPAAKPVLSADSFRGEDYQKAYTAWFESKLGWKGYSVATDNTILYRVFHDTKPGSAVALGEHGVLFKDEDVWFYNKAGDELPSQAMVDALADKIGALQARLRAHHRALVPVIIPSKTSLYREAMPAEWTRDLGQPRPSDRRIYEAMTRALDARHITYVDARVMFTSPQVVRDQVWGTVGRHWTIYGACLAMREVMRDYAALTGVDTPPYDCPLVRKRRGKSHDDFDLWNLLNMWRPPQPERVVPLVEHQAPPPGTAKPSVMFVGTSFCWNIMRDAGNSDRFGAIHMDYYNKLLVAWPADIHTEVRPHSKEWREVFLDRDLYVLDLLEVFLFANESYVDQFLAEVGEELEHTLRDESVTEPTTGATITAEIDLGVTDKAHYFELWGTFPNPATPYAATVTCDGARRDAVVYYQNPNGQQLNVRLELEPGRCDRTQTPPRISGVSCTFHVRQGTAIGSPEFGPRQVCPGPQGKSGQDADGRCTAGLAGC